MQYRSFLVVSFLMIFITATQAQGKRYDTTMKIGKAGYRVFTSNKSDDLNSLTISPVGFEKEARDISVQVKGKVTKCEVDDLNNDGFPDLVIYVLNPGGKGKSTVFALASEKNESYRGIYFPDVYDDQKLRVGYQGGDQYFLMEGTLVRRFPIYNTTDTANIVPTNMVRQVQYRIVNGDRGELRFRVMRTYDFAKQ